MGFAILVVLVRALGPQGFGTLATLLTLVDTGQVLTEAVLAAGMIQAASRQLREGDLARADAAYRLSLLLRLGSGLLAFAVGWLAAAPLSRWLFASEAWAGAVRIAFASLVAVVLYGFPISVLQVQQRFLRLALVSQYRNAARLAALLILVALGTLEVRSAVWAIFVASSIAAVAAFGSIPLGFLRRRGGDRAVAREVLGTSRWMLLAAVGLPGARIDIFMLSGLGSAAEAGIYAAALQLCAAAAILSQAVVTTILPKAAAFRTASEMRSHLRRCARYGPLILAVLLLVLPLSPWLLPWLLGAAYGRTVPVFDLLFASALFTLATNPILMLAFPLGEVRLFALASLTQVGLRVPLNVFVIPAFGAVGAAVIDLLVKLLSVGVVLALLARRLGRMEEGVEARRA